MPDKENIKRKTIKRKPGKTKTSKRKPGKRKTTGRKKINPKDAVKSKDFNRAKLKAKEYMDDPEKLKGLLNEASTKANTNKRILTNVWEELMTLFRLIKTWLQGKYKAPTISILLAIAAIIYFVSPIDLIPDWIPLAGFLDDAVIISFVVASIKNDITDFKSWENTHNI